MESRICLEMPVLSRWDDNESGDESLPPPVNLWRYDETESEVEDASELLGNAVFLHISLGHRPLRISRSLTRTMRVAMDLKWSLP